MSCVRAWSLVVLLLGVLCLSTLVSASTTDLSAQSEDQQIENELFAEFDRQMSGEEDASLMEMGAELELDEEDQQMLDSITVDDEVLMQMATEVAEAEGESADALIERRGGLRRVAKKVGRGLKRAVKSVARRTGKAVKKVGKKVGKVLKKVGKFFKKKGKKLGKSVKKHAKKLGKSVAKKVKKAGKWLKNKIKNALFGKSKKHAAHKKHQKSAGQIAAEKIAKAAKAARAKAAKVAAAALAKAKAIAKAKAAAQKAALAAAAARAAKSAAAKKAALAKAKAARAAALAAKKRAAAARRALLKAKRASKPKLTRPLINGVLSSPYKRSNLNVAADIIKNEPAIAKLDKEAEDEWNGEADGEDRFALEKKLKEELRGLIQLVKQSKQIIKVLPQKEERIQTIKNKLEALRNEYAKEDAIMKYKQQKALMKQIAKQENALKDRVAALKKTEGKLSTNIKKHKKTLKDVGVREQEMKILDM